MAIPRALGSFSLVLLVLVVAPLCCTADSILYSGESLQTGQFLSEGNYQFIMQGDCNLVLYDSNNPIWASNTAGQAANCYVTLQSDGNLVIYKTDGSSLWSSQTSIGQGNYVLILQKDRNVVIYGGARWATGT